MIWLSGSVKLSSASGAGTPKARLMPAQPSSVIQGHRPAASHRCHRACARWASAWRWRSFSRALAALMAAMRAAQTPRPDQHPGGCYTFNSYPRNQAVLERPFLPIIRGLASAHRRVQRARMVGRSLLDLQRAVLDRKTIFERVHDAVHEGVAGVALRHDQVNRQRAFARADAPDM